VPREILTDQGRQYTAWRGVTGFEEELHRQGIRHVKSRPHHPQTCGKIERFWKTMWEEFLSRTVFADFDAGPQCGYGTPRVGFGAASRANSGGICTPENPYGLTARDKFVADQALNVFSGIRAQDLTHEQKLYIQGAVADRARASQLTLQPTAC
jgi:transposase InsO family protein